MELGYLGVNLMELGVHSARLKPKYEFQDYNYSAQTLNNECDVFQVVTVKEYIS